MTAVSAHHAPRGDAPHGPTFRDVARGLLAVLALFATAVDELVTALLGVPPLTPRLLHIRRTIADTYTDGVHDVIPADEADPDETGAL